MDHATRIEALKRQLSQGVGWLRFDGDLEPEFRADLADSVRRRRVGLLLIVLVLIAIMPLLDALWLHPPPEAVAMMRQVQWFVMAPMLLFTLAVCLMRRGAPLTDGVVALGIVVLALGVIEQRTRGSALGWAFPAEFLGAVLAGGLVAGGLRFAVQLVVGWGVFACFAVAEIGAHGSGGEVLLRIYAMGVITVVSLIGGYGEQYVARENWLRRQLAAEMAERDSLSGLLNHRSFHERYGSLFSLAQRERRPLMTALIDIDDFKGYNDAYGHSQGDDCLRQVCSLIRDAARRGTDLVGRIGGEEFAVAGYGVNRDRAEWSMERLREQVLDEGLVHTEATTGLQRVTISIGVVWGVPAEGQRAEEFLRSADRYLYEAKHDGRNRTVIGLPQSSEREPPRSGPRLVRG